MTVADLAAVERWLREPHVARWWIPETTPETELEEFRACVEAEDDPTRLCTVERDRRAVGWCQWYRWDDYPTEADAIGAAAGELGADYAIGDPAQVGCGVGTAMIGAMVEHLRLAHPDAGILIAPEADNGPSRRVLEKNGFVLVGVRPVATEPHRRPMAIYRLAPTTEC